MNNNEGLRGGERDRERVDSLNFIMFLWAQLSLYLVAPVINHQVHVCYFYSMTTIVVYMCVHVYACST